MATELVEQFLTNDPENLVENRVVVNVAEDHGGNDNSGFGLGCFGCRQGPDSGKEFNSWTESVLGSICTVLMKTYHEVQLLSDCTQLQFSLVKF
jgi:hypothetical protein